MTRDPVASGIRVPAHPGAAVHGSEREIADLHADPVGTPGALPGGMLSSVKFPRWYLELPLRAPSIPKGGSNHEGLTWSEWREAACVAAGRPASMLVESWWAKAWACGVDPTDMGSAS